MLNVLEGLKVAETLRAAKLSLLKCGTGGGRLSASERKLHVIMVITQPATVTKIEGRAKNSALKVMTAIVECEKCVSENAHLKKWTDSVNA